MIKIIMETDEHHTVTLTFNCGNSMNTFSSQVPRGLNQAWIDPDSDTTIRVIPLKGAGIAFCA